MSGIKTFLKTREVCGGDRVGSINDDLSVMENDILYEFDGWRKKDRPVILGMFLNRHIPGLAGYNAYVELRVIFDEPETRDEA